MIEQNQNPVALSTLFMEDGKTIDTLIKTSNKDGKSNFIPMEQGSHAKIYISTQISPQGANLVTKVTTLQQDSGTLLKTIQNEAKVVNLILQYINKKGSTLPLTNVVTPYSSGKLYADFNKKTLAGHYFTFEYLSGKLTSLKYNKILSDGNCTFIIHQIATGLSQLVGLHPNFVHRDISLNNIMFTENNQRLLIFKIIDFGTSIIDSARNQENSGVTSRTINAPEILNPDQNKFIIGNKEDIYSLGMCLFILLSQRSKSYGNHLVLPS